MSVSSSIGAVVVTHNSAATLPACISSLAPDCQLIIVVDNASRDTTRQMLQSLPVRVITNADNRGFGAACNQGVAALRTPYVVFLNPDAVVTRGALVAARQYLETHDDVGIVGLHLRDEKGSSERDNFGSEVTLWSLLWRHRFQRDLANGGGKMRPAVIPQQSHRCDWVSAGSLLARREALIEIGGFDPQFFMYWEDVDLGRRLRQAGWQVVFLPKAYVTHQRGASSDNAQAKTRYYDQSADRYFQKHYSAMIWLFQRYCRYLYRFFSPQVR